MLEISNVGLKGDGETMVYAHSKLKLCGHNAMETGIFQPKSDYCLERSQNCRYAIWPNHPIVSVSSICIMMLSPSGQYLVYMALAFSTGGRMGVEARPEAE